VRRPGGGAGTGVTELGRDLRRDVHRARHEFVSLLRELAELESPTDVPAAQEPVQERFATVLEELDFSLELVPGEGRSGGHLVARGPGASHGCPTQLLVGHTDTVWPVGTLEEMPVTEEDGRLHGPGTLDMKGGLTQMVVALRALARRGLEPALPVVVLVNSDEEIGSPESRPLVERLAREADRAWVLEPALGASGRIKTARKGVGHMTVVVRGRPAHAGLEPEKGASAIQELAHVIHALHALTDLDRGITVNVGVVDGGARPNVVAPEARARVDVRVPTVDAGDEVERAIRSLVPRVEGVRLEVEGGMLIPPMEATPRNQALWRAARDAGRELGFDLEEARVGGASDGNTTSRHTATLDGLGCVGDGAHARHEHIVVEPSLDRCALLARLLLLDPEVAKS